MEEVEEDKLAEDHAKLAATRPQNDEPVQLDTKANPTESKPSTKLVEPIYVAPAKTDPIESIYVASANTHISSNILLDDCESPSRHDTPEALTVPYPSGQASVESFRWRGDEIRNISDRNRVGWVVRSQTGLQAAKIIFF